MRRAATIGDLDLLLERLRELGLPYRPSPDDVRLWESVCPSCRTPEWGLRLREPYRNARVSLSCRAGCEDADIRWAFSADPAAWRIDEALELAENTYAIAARALELAAELAAA